MTHSTLAPVTIDYPSSDGKPVAESDFQFTPLAYARDSLRLHFRDRSDVYVAGNLLTRTRDASGHCIADSGSRSTGSFTIR